MLRKSHKGQTPEGESTRRGTGSDQPIVALKPGNAGGAKGLNGSAKGMGQPIMGRNSCPRRGRVGRLTRPSINPQGEESVTEARMLTIVATGS
jgi:hypothetical protein